MRERLKKGKKRVEREEEGGKEERQTNKHTGRRRETKNRANFRCKCVQIGPGLHTRTSE